MIIVKNFNFAKRNYSSPDSVKNGYAAKRNYSPMDLAAAVDDIRCGKLGTRRLEICKVRPHLFLLPFLENNKRKRKTEVKSKRGLRLT